MSFFFTETNVVFSLLNGEAFDYIGSSRLVYDLKKGHFNALGGVNLKFDDIKCVIEFGQLNEGKLYFHSNNGKSNKMINKLQKALNAEVLEGSVPPASIQSFLNENSNLTAVVISSHGAQFENRYYNGMLDDAESLRFNRYCSNCLFYMSNKFICNNIAKYKICPFQKRKK